MTTPDQVRSLLDGFEVRNLVRRNRIVVAVDGRERQGKTHFCMTAPGPIVYLDFDMGGEGVVEKRQREGKTIIVGPPFIIKPPETVDDDNQKLSKEEWARFFEVYTRSLSAPILEVGQQRIKARTIVVDTGSEMEELLRLAWFGKLVQVPTFKYRERNSIMRDIVRQALDSDVNVIFTHKMSAEWKKASSDSDKQSKTGAFERKGFEEMAHLVQANLFAYRCPPPGSIDVTWRYKPGTGEAHSWVAPARESDDLGFRLRILDSRHDPTLEGFELSNDQIEFSNVAQMILPETSAADWVDVA